MSTGPVPQPPGRLVSHFSNRNEDRQAEGWTQLWESSEDNLWDRGKPSPALIDLIESNNEHLPQTQSSNGKRPRALVPGCGKGYDVVMLALHGFDVYGLEVSEKGAETARQHALQQLSSPSSYNFRQQNSEGPQTSVHGKVEIIAGDFFARAWEEKCFSGSEERAGGFDLIYDYTDWARRMRELLAPAGVLVCLEFPLYKDLKAKGPPWGLNGVYWNLLVEGGDGIIEEPGEETPKGNGAFTRLARITPVETFEVSQGTDRLSIWRLKS